MARRPQHTKAMRTRGKVSKEEPNHSLMGLCDQIQVMFNNRSEQPEGFREARSIHGLALWLEAQGLVSPLFGERTVRVKRIKRALRVLKVWRVIVRGPSGRLYLWRDPELMAERRQRKVHKQMNKAWKVHDLAA